MGQAGQRRGQGGVAFFMDGDAVGGGRLHDLEGASFGQEVQAVFPVRAEGQALTVIRRAAWTLLRERPGCPTLNAW